jgi:hypothetical protein
MSNSSKNTNLGCGQRAGSFLISIILFIISYFCFKYGMIYGWILGGFLGILGLIGIASSFTGKEDSIKIDF